jgi:Acetyl-coenzyme A synthetase N-terminus
MTAVTEGQLLWQASPERRNASNVGRFMKHLESTRGLKFDSYRSLWQWSVDQIEDFWAAVWEFYAIKSSTPYRRVLSERRMPGARWFEGAQLNYAEHVFRNATTAYPALIAKSELRAQVELSWAGGDGRRLRRDLAPVRCRARRPSGLVHAQHHRNHRGFSRLCVGGGGVVELFAGHGNGRGARPI